MVTEEVEKAVIFLVKNVGKRPRDLPRHIVKEALLKVEEAALQGLTRSTILTLALKVIFTNGYDQITRRRLLYCLVPQKENFPLQVVPLAVSSAAVKDVSVAWQYAVLAWLQGMLEYGVLVASEPLVHICYTTVFNLTSCLSLSSLTCRILYHMTLREDVTRNRVQSLMKLRLKPAFDTPVSYVLRLYHLFRPDMVAGRLGGRNVVTHLYPVLKARLLAGRQRLQAGAGQVLGLQGKDRVWRDGVKAEKINVYQRPTPIPQPQFNIYTTTVAEKKRKVIYVTQYQRFSELVRGMDKCEWWVWPTNPAAHLACPLVVPLFRPHQVQVQVALTNWLEVALRTEVVEGIGAPSWERQESLLRSALQLCFTHAASLPVISNFLVELMTKWNQHDHFEMVIRLLEYVGFTSFATLCDTLLGLISRLLTTAPLITWCRVVETLTHTTCRWLIAAHQYHGNLIPDGYEWPQQEEHERPLIGVWFLTEKLERHFLAGILNYHSHPLILHHILDYYAQIDMYCEELELPMLFCPPAIMTLAIITSADLAATHRLGRALARMKVRLATLERLQEEGCEDPLLQDNLLKVHEINTAVFLFLSGVLQGKALSSSWRKQLEPFYPFEFLEETLEREAADKYASVTHALPYLSLACEALAQTEAGWTTQKFEEVRGEVLADLGAAGLTGIEECSKTYGKE